MDQVEIADYVTFVKCDGFDFEMASGLVTHISYANGETTLFFDDGAAYNGFNSEIINIK